jgi:hypothetical protein
MTMRIEYDREAKALYLHVAEGEHARAVEVEPLKSTPKWTPRAASWASSS